MKRLLLMRHAKAASDEEFSDDESRPLTERGRAAATQIAEYIAAHNHMPELILCSTALRTRQTLDRLESAIGKPLKSEFLKELYLASAGEMLAIINNQIPADVNSCMIIGHNPGMHVLAHELAGNGDKDAIKALRYNFPTAAIASIKFEVKSWREITPASGTLEYYIHPKML